MEDREVAVWAFNHGYIIAKESKKLLEEFESAFRNSNSLYAESFVKGVDFALEQEKKQNKDKNRGKNSGMGM